MSEKKRQKALYILLVAALAFGVYNFVTPRKRYVPGGAIQTETETAPVEPVAAAQPPVNIEAIEKASWGRDPFTQNGSTPSRPTYTRVAVSAEPNLTWQLSAIVFNDSHPMAVVNGKTVKVGDVVDRAQVIKIDRNKVTLHYNGSSFDIRANKG